MNKDLEEMIPEAPPNWLYTYNTIKAMRAHITAPVDAVGCEATTSKPSSLKERRFETLLYLMLSSQTKDEATTAAVERFRKEKLTFGPEVLCKYPMDRLEKVIYPVSFYRVKAKHILKTCEILISKHHGDVPSEYTDLIALPGVGPKMAHLVLQINENRIEGIAVDTHVHRICKRIGWTPQATTPEHTRKSLEKWLPRKYWAEINPMLIGFGQVICLPRIPKCRDCDLNKTCPSSLV